MCKDPVDGIRVEKAEGRQSKFQEELDAKRGEQELAAGSADKEEPEENDGEAYCTKSSRMATPQPRQAHTPGARA